MRKIANKYEAPCNRCGQTVAPLEGVAIGTSTGAEAKDTRRLATRLPMEDGTLAEGMARVTRVGPLGWWMS